MVTKQIKTDDYNIEYSQDEAVITFQGSLRLSGMDEYAPIVEILDAVAEAKPEIITLNLLDLEFLNSSGISMLSKFVIKIRQKKEIGMLVKGSKKIPWQGKSLKNLQRLMPKLTLEME
ncbi:slr1659 superfamily regulator [Roseofilum casamattae]|uniref:STAS domain-containing protein n=1 Tax=Roseofilum casamattae BLCC-M143 TaxID=3022442 RepID=A0ABT7BYD4_9CYAN|nr:hypothetical protein [Roseofilum casamattae]MDJ1184085.1 hypothetical protein [Roseofilum casamattae BLCC-M143]